MGLACLHRSCLAYLNANFVAAHRHAIAALRQAESSGHHNSLCSALINLGAAYLALGQPMRAEKALIRAREQCIPCSTLHALAVETLAETWLAIRKLADCSLLLDSVVAELQLHDHQLSDWHADWSLATHMRLWQRLGDQRGHAPGPQAGALCAGWSCSPVKQRLQLLAAENCIRSHKTQEATDALSLIERSGSLASAALGGQKAALHASLHEQQGDHRRAEQLYRLALLVLSAAGETADLVDCVSRYSKYLAMAWPSGDRTVDDDAWTCAGLRRPVIVTSALDKATPLQRRGEGTLSDGLLDIVRVLPYRGQHPEVIGEFILRYLSEQAYITRGRLLGIDKKGREISLVSFGQTGPVESRTWGDNVTIGIGKTIDSEFRLVLSLASTMEAAQNGLVITHLLGGTSIPASNEGDGSLLPVREGEVVSTGGAVFASPTMLSLLSSARLIAATDANILITGESGTGKDVLARFIHGASSRADRPFVPFNCGTVPRDMVDSQLFGHRKGAFTGATDNFEGLIQGASGGTLFLDEISDLPLEAQPKLLRFLDTKEVQSLGSPRPTIVDVRVIAATNAEPEQLISRGQFRRDLYYRLNTFRVEVPPLRQRRDDIDAMIDEFLNRYSERLHKNVSLSRAARTHLLLFDWPGNVRQLSSELYRLVAHARDGESIDENALSREIVASQLKGSWEGSSRDLADTDGVNFDVPLKQLLEWVERAAVEHAMAASGGNQSAAAKRLGLSRKGLYLMRQRLRIVS